MLDEVSAGLQVCVSFNLCGDTWPRGRVEMDAVVQLSHMFCTRCMATSEVGKGMPCAVLYSIRNTEHHI